MQRIGRERYGVELTPLSYVPGGNVQKYLGNLNFFFIRESTSIRESGGVSGFVHSFITEMLAVVRAHVTALGGNALVSFYMTELELVDNPHKNQVSVCVCPAAAGWILISLCCLLMYHCTIHNRAGSMSDQCRRRCGLCVVLC